VRRGRRKVVMEWMRRGNGRGEWPMRRDREWKVERVGDQRSGRESRGPVGRLRIETEGQMEEEGQGKESGGEGEGQTDGVTVHLEGFSSAPKAEEKAEETAEREDGKEMEEERTERSST